MDEKIEGALATLEEWLIWSEPIRDPEHRWSAALAVLKSAVERNAPRVSVSRLWLMEQIKWWAVSPDSCLLENIEALLRSLGVSVESGEEGK